MLIYSGEQCKGTVWRIVNKRPQAYAFVLSLCQHSPSGGGGGGDDPGFLVLFRFFALPRVGCGAGLCTLCGSARVLLPGL